MIGDKMKVVGLIALKDAEAFERYRSQVGQTIECYGGTVVFRGTRDQVFWNELGCAEFNAFVEIEFPTSEAATQWANSAEYGALLAVRNEALSVTLFGVS
jgi:uncharacterized protein (DUF1330 family)